MKKEITNQQNHRNIRLACPPVATSFATAAPVESLFNFCCCCCCCSLSLLADIGANSCQIDFFSNLTSMRLARRSKSIAMR